MDAAARGAGGTLDGPPLVDPGGLVERVIGRYRGLSRERGIELIGSIAIGLPAIETSEERSEEHTSELQSLMRTSYAVFCLKTKTPRHQTRHRRVSKLHSTN